MKFIVRSGEHTGNDGVTYYAGDEVESDRDLTAAFPNKFDHAVQVTVAKAKTQAALAAAQAADAANPPPELEEPDFGKVPSDPMKVPDVVRHHQKIEAAAEIKFAGKRLEEPAKVALLGSAGFKEVKRPNAPVTAAAEDGDEEEDGEFDENAPSVERPPLGVDVTEKFPTAGTAGLLVFQKEDESFVVADKDRPTRKVNKTELLTKGSVLKYLKANS